jgi:hypothetical protein
MAGALAYRWLPLLALVLIGVLESLQMHDEPPSEIVGGGFPAW